MDQIELACPYCAGRFQAEAATQSRATNCPNCGRMVTVPALPARVPPPPPVEHARVAGVESSSPQLETSRTGGGEDADPSHPLRVADQSPQRPVPDAAKLPHSPFDLVEPTKTLVNRRGEPIPLRKLSPGERERYRRRLNLVFAAIGMAILAVALAVLLRVRP